MIVAIDLGGTVTKVGTVQDGVVTSKMSLPSGSSEGLEQALTPLSEVVDQLVGDQHVDAIGFAMPGLIDRDAVRARSVNGKWEDAPTVDLAGWAKENWLAPLVLENDAVAALAGEWHSGAAQGTDAAVMVTFGTGIGTAALVGGQLLRGTHGQAAIGAHFTVVAGGRRCTCGNIGCAEAEASTSVLPQIARSDPRFASSKLNNVPVVDYYEVFRHAPEDALSADLKGRALDVWSALIVTLVHAYDPEVLVIGGGIAAAGDDLMAPLSHYLARHAWTPWGQVELRLGTCGSDAALIGVAAIAHGDLG